jgi:DNA-binding response OmpR family regulator
MKKHILFVDDEPQILEALQRVLREQSDQWEMTYVDHPADAWEKLLNETYDAVVSDIQMDDMSGLQLLDLIQHTDKTKNIPVVMLTGLDDQSLKQQALELGAIDLLHKPIEPGQLVARLQSVLRLKSYQDGLNASNELLRQIVLDQKCELTRSRLNLVCR